uniref:Uncharacterized protein n=1 Tax=Micrurus carvalhoi TaxID=3147026 RepID=A0A2H6NE06_9SAUR
MTNATRQGYCLPMYLSPTPPSLGLTGGGGGKLAELFCLLLRAHTNGTNSSHQLFLFPGVVPNMQFPPPMLSPLTILDHTVSTVETFKFLGSVTSQDLKWTPDIKNVIKKAQ